MDNDESKFDVKSLTKEQRNAVVVDFLKEEIATTVVFTNQSGTSKMDKFAGQILATAYSKIIERIKIKGE